MKAPCQLPGSVWNLSFFYYLKVNLIHIHQVDVGQTAWADLLPAGQSRDLYLAQTLLIHVSIRQGLATKSIFWCLLFVIITCVCLKGKSMTLLKWGQDRYYSFFTPQLPKLGFLKGLTRVFNQKCPQPHPLPCFWNNRKTRILWGVPRHYQEQQLQTLIVCLYKTHFNTIILGCK